MFRKIRVVCFGGGTGLPALLSGLKHNPWLEITAIVNMFDTGGSSGELRDRFGILPPGDVLKCLLALAKHEAYARELLQKRIRNHRVPGHTSGNALLLGLEKVFGDCASAIDALGQSLSIRGRVIPVTFESSNCCAMFGDGSFARGETSIDLGIHEGKRVKSLFLDPSVSASLDACRAIQAADVFCIGPGSFYTSVLPNFLPRSIREVLRDAHGKIIYIANLFTEGKGMKGMELVDCKAVVEDYIGRSIDLTLANNHWDFPETIERYVAENKYPLRNTLGETEKCIEADLWRDPEIARHDCSRLAHLVSFAIYRCCSFAAVAAG